MENKPKVSIIIPCYNSEEWIEKSVHSALSQSYKNLEVIFVDNESTDESFEVVKQIKDSRLIMSSAPNLYKHSWSEPVEEALSISEGEYFTILGSDDYIADDYVEKNMSIIAKSGKIELLQSPIRCINQNNQLFGGDISHTYRNLSEFKQALFLKCPVTTPSVFYKKELYYSGLLKWNSEEFLGAADYELYFNLADKGHFIYPFPRWLGYYYRIHDGQATWGMHSESKNYDKLVQEKWRTRWGK